MNAHQTHTAANMGRVRRLHFIGIGGAGMSGIAEVVLNLGCEVTGSDLRDGRPRGACARRGRGLHRPSARSRSGTPTPWWSPPPSTRTTQRSPRPRARRLPRGASRRDARGADALLLRRSGGRNPRQDHHHQSGGQCAHRGRARSHLRHRRPAQQRRRQRPSSAPASTWWPRPTRATRPSSTCSPWCRSSPTSTPTTCSPTATTSIDCAAPCLEFLQNLPFYGLAVLCVDDDEGARAPACP